MIDPCHNKIRVPRNPLLSHHVRHSFNQCFRKCTVFHCIALATLAHIYRVELGCVLIVWFSDLPHEIMRAPFHPILQGQSNGPTLTHGASQTSPANGPTAWCLKHLTWGFGTSSDESESSTDSEPSDDASKVRHQRSQPPQAPTMQSLGLSPTSSTLTTWQSQVL